MKIISSAAHFVVCELCYMHGHIVFADGGIGKEVSSKRIALKYVENYLNAGRLCPDELPVLKEQIENSPLPELIQPEMELLQDLVEDEFFEEGPEEEDTAPHKVH